MKIEINDEFVRLMQEGIVAKFQQLEQELRGTSERLVDAGYALEKEKEFHCGVKNDLKIRIETLERQLDKVSQRCFEQEKEIEKLLRDEF